MSDKPQGRKPRGTPTAEHASYGDCLVASVAERDARGVMDTRPPAPCA